MNQQNDNTNIANDNNKSDLARNRLQIPKIENQKFQYPNSKIDYELDYFPSMSHKRYTSLVLPPGSKNRMSLQKSRQMSFGGRINKNNMQKITIYGKSVSVGLGFPTRAPVINNPESDKIKKSDESFNNLEILINNLKSKCLENSENNENLNVNSVENHFIQVERNILNEFTVIRSSINSLIEERKEMQKQHKIWLEKMREKIFQTKYEV